MLNFIINSKSGFGRGHRNSKKIMDYCFKRGIAYSYHITAYKGHATEIARFLSTFEPENTIVAVGGDGTFHEVMNGIVSPHETALGFIPSGRGNDYARAAKLSLNPLKALRRILNGRIVYTDYIAVGDSRCLNVAGTGLDIDVLQRVAGRNGKLTYLLSLIHCIKNFKPYDIKVTRDGITTPYSSVMVGVCNGIAIGGGLKLNPLGKIDDGKMDVMILKMPKDGNLMRVLPKFKKGKHLGLELTVHYTCDEIIVESANGKPIQLDGEIYENRLLHCTLKKGGLKTFSQEA